MDSKEPTQSQLFEKIADICDAVTTILDSKQLLEVSLERIMRLFSASRGSIFLFDDKDSSLNLQVMRGMELQEEKRMVKKMGEGVVGRVAETKEPIYVNDIAQDQRFKNYKSRSSYRTPSFICAPLLIKDQLIGVINISDKDDESRFTKEELQLLDFLASQIALNYRRVELYKKFKSMVQESETLKDELGRNSEEKDELKRQVVLQEKLATIGKLAGGIAHEFNNPLDGVMRYTNLCLEQTDPDDVTHGYLMEIKGGLGRMANIVKSLLACSRNSAPTLESVDPNAVVEQAVKGELLPRDVLIELNLDQNRVRIIDFGFERIVVNLLRNAIDAVGGKGKITIATVNDNKNVVLKVSDTGGGIQEEQLQKIFEPFYTTKDMDKGCGLGLTIVTEIVKNYEGQINIETSKGRGTTFFVSVPIKKP